MTTGSSGAEGAGAAAFTSRGAVGAAPPHALQSNQIAQNAYFFIFKSFRSIFVDRTHLSGLAVQKHLKVPGRHWYAGPRKAMRRILPYVLFAAAPCCGNPDSAPPAPVAAVATDEPSAPAAMTRRDADALVKGWCSALSSGDTAALDAMYATRFDGILKGNGPAQHFTREEWLGGQMDRIAGASCVADGPTDFIAGTGLATAAIARDDVRWTVSLLVIDEDGARIAREKWGDRMASGNGPLPEDFSGFFLMLDDRHVVIQVLDKPLPDDGALFVDDETAMRPVPDELLTRPLRWTLKQNLILGYADGTTGVVSISGTRLVARFKVHASMRQYWRDADVSEEERGADLWRLAQATGSIFLVGQVRPKRSGALFAMVDKGNAPELYHPVPVIGGERRELLARLKKREDWQVLQDRFAAGGRTGDFSHHDSKLWTQGFRNDSGRRRFAAIRVQAGSGCGDFFGSITGLFAQKKVRSHFWDIRPTFIWTPLWTTTDPCAPWTSIATGFPNSWARAN